MATTQQEKTGPAPTTRLVDSVDDLERSSLKAVRKFVDTVNGAFPEIDLTNDEGPRRKIIDSAFTMVEQLLGATNDLTREVLKVTEGAMSERTRTESSK